jgi:hypothetical protein
MLQPLSNAHNNWAASNHEIFISCPRSLGYSAPRSQRPPPLSSVRKPHRKLTVQMNRRFDSSSGGKACRGKDAVYATFTFRCGNIACIASASMSVLNL